MNFETLKERVKIITVPTILLGNIINIYQSYVLNAKFICLADENKLLLKQVSILANENCLLKENLLKISAVNDVSLLVFITFSFVAVFYISKYTGVTIL